MILKKAGCISVLLLAAVQAASCQAVQPVAAESSAEIGRLLPVTLVRGAKKHVFRVEIADTPAKQARGLMYRNELPADGGMLFPFSPPQRAVFWMKNTLIPLDMIFIRADGKIARIAANTMPLSLEPVDAGEQVVAVLELAGGAAAAAGIGTGDRATWPGGPR